MMQEHTSSTADRMYAAAWIAARSILPSDHVWPEGRASMHLVDLVQRGGTEFYKLQELYDMHANVIVRRGSTAQLLNFVDGDLNDVFRGLTTRLAGLISNEGGGDVYVDPLELEGELDLLLRYLDLSIMAASFPEVPRDYQVVFRDVGSALRLWGIEVREVIGEMTAPGAPLSD